MTTDDEELFDNKFTNLLNWMYTRAEQSDCKVDWCIFHAETEDFVRIPTTIVLHFDGGIGSIRKFVHQLAEGTEENELAEGPKNNDDPQTTSN